MSTISTGSSKGGLSIADVKALYADGSATPESLIRDLYPKLQAAGCAFTYLAPLEQLVAQAQQLQQIPAEQRGVLWGVPCAAKDNVDVGGMPTTAACPDFLYTPGSSAPAVQALQEAGAIVVGKTNMDQFAAGLVGTRSPYGAPRTPFDSRFISGGSSSGSAVVVAQGLVSFALGTDTAGSGRVPAGLCGCVGMKGTVGSVSTVGVVPACASLDCLTVFASCVEDGATLMRIMGSAHAGPRDVWRRAPPAHVTSPPTVGFRFAVPRLGLGDWRCAGGVQQAKQAAEQFDLAVARLKACGGVQVEIDLTPFTSVAPMLYGTAFLAERYSGIRSFLESKAAPAKAAVANGKGAVHVAGGAAGDGVAVVSGGVGDVAHDTRLLPVTRTIIAGASRFTAADLYDAYAKLAELRAQAMAALQEVDLLLVPTALAHYTVQEIQSEEDTDAPKWTQNANLGRFTNFVNLLDMCGVAVPSGLLHLDAEAAAQEAAEAGTSGCLSEEEVAAVAARTQHLKETGSTKVTLPFGVTLLTAGWRDEWLWGVAASMHSASGLGCGPAGHGVSAPTKN